MTVYDATGGIDFLNQERAPEGVEAIVTNCPYKIANKFARHAIRLVPRVAMLMRLAFIESAGRSDILDGGQLARVLVFRERLPMMHRDGWEGPKIDDSGIAMAWFVWERAHRGGIELKRISCRNGGGQ